MHVLSYDIMLVQACSIGNMYTYMHGMVLMHYILVCCYVGPMVRSSSFLLVLEEALELR